MSSVPLMIKICGITRREDAEAAVAAGATALGFIFVSSSPRYVDPHQAAALASGLNVWKVGVFVDEPAASVRAIADAAKLDIVQLYQGDAPDGIRTWRAFRGTKEAPATIDKAQIAGAEAVLLDGPSNGKGFDWATARDASQNGSVKVIVAGGLNIANVAEAIRIARPWGIDASSSLETSPGIKDHNKIRQFIRAAKEAA
ncbi:MAG: phosphoribosylanthranilate isomerase [Acidobacteriota bacterium]